jgi:hypothetical protein
LLRCLIGAQAETVSNLVSVRRRQSVNAAATRKEPIASVASSSWPRRSFCMNASPVMMTRAVRSVR